MTVVAMIDATHVNVSRIPQGAPKVAGYVTGSGGIAWDAADWARFPRSGHVRVDQSPSLSRYAAHAADVADVEDRAGTVPAFVAATKRRVAHNQLGCIYGSGETLASASAELAAAGVNLAHVYAWLADWDLSQSRASALVGTLVHGLHVIAVQWASPTSNPSTVVPGGTATLRGAQVDLSAADASWFPAPAAPRPVISGVVVDTGLHAQRLTTRNRQTWTAT